MHKLFDAHASLIQRDVLDYHGTALAALDGRSFDIKDYVLDTHGRGISDILLVAALSDNALAEARMIGAVALEHPTRVRGIIAGCDPWQMSPTAMLQAWDGLPVKGCLLYTSPSPRDS